MAAVEGKPEEGSCYLDRGFDLSGHLLFKDQLVYILAMSRQTPVQLPRGRPRSFDVEAAVGRAMGVFWSHAGKVTVCRRGGCPGHKKLGFGGATFSGSVS